MGHLLVHSEVGTAGLGNRLFPWARAEVFRQKHGLGMLAPGWIKLKIGPLLRGEKDKRYYTDLFSSKGYVRGLQRWYRLLTAKRIPEAQASEALASKVSNGLIWFSGMEGIFDPILGHQQFLLRRMMEIVTERNRQVIQESAPPWIAIHVRRGDVRTIEHGKAWDRSMTWLGLPEEWYIRAIEQMRAWAGWDVPVTIFTDAYEHQIPKLLALRSTSIFPKNPAIVDMLVMSKARIILPTTSSTFSMWSAFVGEMPILFYPGERLVVHPKPEYNIDTTTDGDIAATAEPLIRDLLKQP